jgi:hypothetical protein
MPEIPDFTSASWQKKRSQLTVAILDGQDAKMPSFADRLTKEEARELAVFVSSLAGPDETELAAEEGAWHTDVVSLLRASLI